MNALLNFLKKESAPGIMLMLSAALAMICANTDLNHYYQLYISLPVEIRVAELVIAKPLLLWINDGLMAVFFFFIGLELKRELIEGELSQVSNIILPAIGAIGGMALPAAFYLALNHDDPAAVEGWAIPAATDIAFALGALALLGSRVPTSLKVFLTSLAIFDDIGAIIIIAIFYTENISFTALTIVACCIPFLFALNRLKVDIKGPYLVIAAILWVATLKSGVHATLAGVVMAMFIPMKSNDNPHLSPLKEIEHDLHGIVSFIILPVFAFANAGITFVNMNMQSFTHDVPVGIALGLFLGKQAGIFGLCFLAIKLGVAKLPRGMNWMMLWGTSALCGIGFTMSLFIGSLAFENNGVDILFDERLGIIFGSLISGVFGYYILKFTFDKQDALANKS